MAAICEVNRVVRDLAGRLLVNLVMAFAGQTPASANALPGSSAVVNVLNTKTVCSTDQAIGSEDSDLETATEAAHSLGQFTCADEDEIRSTLSMPRGSVQSSQVSFLALSLMSNFEPGKGPVLLLTLMLSFI